VVEHGWAALGDRTNNIAFGKNANDAALNIGDHNRANVLREQNLGDFSQRPMRLGRDDVSALGSENVSDCHFCLPEKILRSVMLRLPTGSGKLSK
jgi:hypothetical protein